MSQTELSQVTGLSNVIDINYLNKTNASFERKNGFLSLRMGEDVYARVYLHRAFPFEKEFEYISVLNEDKKEVGFIQSIEKDFEASSAALLKEELAKKYFCPKIEKITGMKDNYGFMQMKTVTDHGELTFGIRDIYRNILKVGGGRIFIVDIDGNRYEIPSVEALDRASYKKIELYL
ncbi:MAG: DUF1854 domain-containing protein [Clostridiales bacterium]|nr:DUF1854 domain-containing protein [Clostridiales bacterium]